MDRGGAKNLIAASQANDFSLTGTRADGTRIVAPTIQTIIDDQLTNLEDIANTENLDAAEEAAKPTHNCGGGG